MKLIWTVVLTMTGTVGFSQKKYYMLIGTYTGTGSKGIYVRSFDSRSAESGPVDSVETSNPSFLTVSANQKSVYAVHENANESGKGGSVTAFSFNRKTGVLKATGSQSSEGKHPCYLALDKTNAWLAVGNYSSGNLAILPVRKDGGIDAAVTTMQHNGSGPDKRQASAHVHSTMFSQDNRFLFVNDLGIDKVITYRFNQRSGQLSFHASTSIAAGSGPRHMALHPTKSVAYLLNELTGSINVFSYNIKDVQLAEMQTIPSVKAGFTGFAGSADIHISADGKFLYASNRGEANDIGIFAINKTTGLLTLIAHQSVLGKAPRNFSIDPSGKFLLVANQDTNEIVLFLRNKKTGLLTDTGKRISVLKPVCIQWIRKKK
ncbi:MAG: lactonase family protein [Chitinophagaceae bacterium]|nr:MAG: lactonase family protein [Chitinophagaceae bacterium]